MIELAAILVLGIFAQWLAWRVNQPAILPLLFIGLLFGPISTFITPDNSKLIDPSRIFEGNMMYYFISLSVGVILFEGGLTLRIAEVKVLAKTVRNLLIIGSAISFFGGGFAAHYFLGMDYKVAFLFGALIIVTGPTVIGPIIRSVHPNKNVSTILKWESILIDPFGALVAVLVYEFILSGRENQYFTLFALKGFIMVIFIGAIIGIFFAWLIYFIIKRKLIPEFLINAIVLGVVILAYALADSIKAESGLLAVTLMGMILANVNIKQLKNIFNFKESLTIILVSILFIILAANIKIEQLEMLGWSSFAVFAIVVFVLRPLGVFISSAGAALSFNEKLFISWVGPRGIVAASIASLFSYNLVAKDVFTGDSVRYAEMLLPLTFLIIIGTVVLQGSTAKFLARKLGVLKEESIGFLIVGSNEASRIIANYIQKLNLPVVLIDSSRANVNEAANTGLRALQRNILSDDLQEELEYEDFGTMMALTSSNDINIFATKLFRTRLGENTSYRLTTRNEIRFSSLHRPDYVLFGPNIDFLRLLKTARDYPVIRERRIKSDKELAAVLALPEQDFVPLFLKNSENMLRVIPANHQINVQEGESLVYFGKEIKSAETAQS